MQLRDDAEADREREFDRLAFTQAHVAGLDEDPGRTQITCTAETTAMAR